MYEINQTEVPAAFMDIYCRHGRPLETLAMIGSRHEACEELSHQVSTFCTSLQAKDELSEAEVLARCYAGLLASPETVSEPEARWVIGRVAELLEWPNPEVALIVPSNAPN
jgi:hypothetical protein